MTVTLHKSITAADGHGILSGLGPYASAAARRAATVTAAHVAQGCVSLQTDTTPPTLWYLVSQSSGVPTWVQINTTADSVGNFGALVPGVSLYLRGDLGLGLTGTVVNTWANQAGSASNLAEKTSTAGIGATTGAGVGGKASVIADGSTQAGTFTLSLAAPGTTPTFYYLVSKQIRTSLGGHPQRIICNTANNNMVLYQDAASDNLIAYGDTANKLQAITHVWARTAVLYCGSTSDRLKWGSAAELTGTQLQTAAGGVSTMLLGYDPGSGTYNQAEYALVLIGSGVTSANYVATLAALDAAVVSWFGAGNVLV